MILSHLVTLNNNTDCINVNEITQHMKLCIRGIYSL